MSVHKIETQSPEVLSSEELRADTARLVGQTGLLLAEVSSAINEGEALLESSKEDASKQLSGAENSATSILAELAERQDKMAAKLEELLSVPEVSKLIKTLKSVQEMSASGISDRSLVESFSQEAVILDVVEETPKETFLPVRELQEGVLPTGVAKGDVDGLSINARKLYKVSVPGYELTANVTDGDIASSEGPMGYESVYKTPVSITEYNLQVGGDEGFVVSDSMKEGLTIGDTHGSLVQLIDTNARVAEEYMPSKQIQVLGKSQYARTA